ncbi:MAG: lysylphosphatidylglycerol synthase transmembrane domain-containing protein, partial [Burkholderiales bacterium]
MRNLAVAGLAVALLVVFLRNAHLRVVWQEIRHAEVALIATAIASMFVNLVIRSVRWQYLLRPVGPATFGNAFSATSIGLAATFLLPARAGEFLRPYVLARRERFSAAAAFATVVLERVLDLLTVVLLLATFVLFFDPGMSQRDSGLYGAVRFGGLLGLATAFGLLAVMFALAGRPAGVTRMVMKLETILPRRMAHLTARLAGLFAEGLAVARDPGRLLVSLTWSVLLWLSIGFGIWTTSRAFHIDIPFSASFLLIALLSVGVAVPTPGGVGGFHEAFRIGATAFYGVPNDRAIGAAIVLHAVSFIPVTLAGLV